MPSIYILGAFILVAYVLQIILGMRQLKQFNQVYKEMRSLGRVAIGRRAGKVRSGTIVLFAIDDKGIVLSSKRMQGVTVLADFKDMPDYIGQDLHYLDIYHPLVRKENKLMQIAIEDARELFLRIEAGNYKDIPRSVPLIDWRLHLAAVGRQLKQRFKL